MFLCTPSRRRWSMSTEVKRILLVEDSREMFAVLEEHDMFNEVIVASDGGGGA
jgi:hypothetical protein